MKAIFKRDDPTKVNCLYMDLKDMKGDLRILNILEVVTYIKTGKYNDLPDLNKRMDWLKSKVATDDQANAVLTTMPNVQFGLGYTKDWFEKHVFKPSNLIVFDYRHIELASEEKLNRLCQMDFVLLSFKNFYGGRTLIIREDNRVYSGVSWSWQSIQRFIHDHFGLDDDIDFDLTEYNIQLFYDPEVKFNQNAITFGEWISGN